MYRDFDLFVGEEPVGEAVSVWLLDNFETRQMMPLSILGSLADTTGGEYSKTRKLTKLKMPETLSLDEVRLMHNSDLDVNDHVNNTRYAEFVTDSLHVERLPENQFLSELQIGYVKECRAGEQISMLTGQMDGAWYVRGVDGDGTPRFDAKAAFSTVDPS
jgi:acyl-ACP thioesterase